MNKIIPLIAFAMLLTQFVQAQIKRKYKDEKYAQQTVVVKQKASQSDLDILNSQFDLDDVAVGEVIRITTETDPQKTPTLPEQVQEAPEEEIVALVPNETVTEEVIEKEAIEIPIQSVEEEDSPTLNTSSRSSNRSIKKVRSKRKNSKFKKQKRRKHKRSKNRWKNKCYQF